MRKLLAGFLALCTAVSFAAYQSPGSVAVTGGTINGTTVGATTPAAGFFNGLTITGSATGTFVDTDGVSANVNPNYRSFAINPSQAGTGVHWADLAECTLTAGGGSITGNGHVICGGDYFHLNNSITLAFVGENKVAIGENGATPTISLLGLGNCGIASVGTGATATTVYCNPFNLSANSGTIGTVIVAGVATLNGNAIGELDYVGAADWGVSSATALNGIKCTIVSASGHHCALSTGSADWEISGSMRLGGPGAPNAPLDVIGNGLVSGTLGVSGLINPAATVGVAGTTTNDNVQAGSVGEYFEARCAFGTTTTGSFTNASPTVGTWTAPPFLSAGTAAITYMCPMNFTANPPTGLSNATNYWIVPITATTFHVASSAANAAAGTFLNTSGTSSTANMTADALMTTATTIAVGGVGLTAGDWDCQASVYYVPAASTSVTNLEQGVGASSTAFGALGSFTDEETAANVVTATNNPVLATPVFRGPLSSTTPIYAVAQATFTVSTMAATSDIRCRRMR